MHASVPIPNSLRHARLPRAVFSAALRVRFRYATALAVRRSPRDPYLDPYRVTFVTPAMRGWEYRRTRPGLGHVEGGDWDLSPGDVEQDDEFQALCAVLRGEASWPQTRWYRRARAEIEAGRGWFRLKTVAQLDAHCARIDTLWDSIRTNGYLTQQELAKRGRPAHQPRSFSEIEVSITRTGELLFTDGRHRLCMARALGLDLVPAQVAARHADWMDTRFLLAEAVAQRGGLAPEPLEHPDLDNIPAAAPLCQGMPALQERLLGDTRTVLDMTPRWGVRARALARAGHRVSVLADTPLDARVLVALGRQPGASYRLATSSDLRERDDIDTLVAGPDEPQLSSAILDLLYEHM